jgi:hypothetical protein
MNRLNDEQLQHWEDQGYLHLKNIVPRDEIATCLNAVDQLLEQHKRDNPGGKMPRWHLDAGRARGQVRVAPNSLPINFKNQFFLTDIPKENHANFCLVPGSHRQPMPKKEGRLEPTGNRRHRPCRCNSDDLRSGRLRRLS